MGALAGPQPSNQRVVCVRSHGFFRTARSEVPLSAWVAGDPHRGDEVAHHAARAPSLRVRAGRAAMGRRACRVLAGAVLLFHGTVVAADVRPGDRAPPFDLPSVDGASYSLQRALQDHPVLIAFISFPCKPCEDSIPSFNAICDLHDRTNGLEIVCISVSEPAAVERLVRSERFDCRAQVLVDGMTDGRHETADAYGVLGTPMFFLVGRNGTVLWKHVGRLRWEKAKDSILEAIAAD